jgi:CRP-like cAMP-binding protein
LEQESLRKELSVSTSDLVSRMSRKMLFAGIGCASLEKVAEIIKVYEYPEETIIFAESQYGDSLYVVEEGVVELRQTFCDELRGSKYACLMEVIEANHLNSCYEKGDFFGEMCLVDLEPRSLEAKSRSRTIVWEINRDDLYWLFGNDKELQLQILLTIARVLSRRLSALSNPNRSSQIEVLYQE